MNWTLQNKTRSALSAITGDPALYEVYTLHLAMDEDIVAGCVDFWTRMLIESPRCWTDKWEILLIEFWTDAGLLAGIFTTADRSFDERRVYKLLSDKIQNEYEELVGSYLGSLMFGPKHQELQDRYWAIIKAAARMDIVPELIESIRKNRKMPIWGTLCYFQEYMFDLGI